MARLVLSPDLPAHVVSRHIQGSFAEHLGRCIYDGIYVGEGSPIPNTDGMRNDIVAAFKKIRMPNLRWPGGCFADEYHWEDGIGPRKGRPTMVNSHWGGVTENNAFGTHEFLRLCELVGCEPYICGNVGSGTVREMQQWVEYLTAKEGPQAERRKQNGRAEPWKVPFFGVGNENWGCGGNMQPEYYADEYRRYQTYVRNWHGHKLEKIACGPNGGNDHWTEVMMREAGDKMDGLALHHYTITGEWKKKGSATGFPVDEWHQCLKNTLVMESLIRKHTAIMDRFDPAKRVNLVVDEWGTWFAVEPGTNPGFLYQQNSIRDALVAAINLQIFATHGDRVRLANIAQTVNVLQSIILTEGAKMVMTPTFHAFDLMQVHQDGRHVPAHLEEPGLDTASGPIPHAHAGATVDASGQLHVSLVNLSPDAPLELPVEVRGVQYRKVSGRVLTAPRIDSHNTFDAPDAVKPVAVGDVKLTDTGARVALPPRSLTVLTFS